MLSWKDLSSEQRLTYLVGLVAQRAVELDAGTRDVFATLTGTDPSVAWDASRAMESRVTRIKGLIEATPDLRREDRKPALQAVEAALKIYQERNRFIHDRLLPSGAARDQWFMSRLDRPKGEERPASRDNVTEHDLLNCERQLVRASWRMWALSQLVKQHRSAQADFRFTRWALLVADNFDLHQDDTISYSW